MSRYSLERTPEDLALENDYFKGRAIADKFKCSYPEYASEVESVEVESGIIQALHFKNGNVMRLVKKFQSQEEIYRWDYALYSPNVSGDTIAALISRLQWVSELMNCLPPGEPFGD